jgi:hypothetical protein
MLLLANLFLILNLAPQAPAAGTWQGSFDITDPSGKQDHAKAVFFLGRTGDQWLGGLGEGEKDLSALSSLKVDAQTVSFNDELPGTFDLNFQLRMADGHLKGTGSGQMRGQTVQIKIDFEKDPKVHTLFEQVANLDGQLFDAFNKRDMGPIAKTFAKDLEFYHDKTGLTGYAWNVSTMRDTLSEKDHYRRQLDPTTLEVYEIKDYGLMEMGVHRFYTTSPGQPERLTATAKFAHIWRFKDGKWELTRVISYDHH